MAEREIGTHTGAPEGAITQSTLPLPDGSDTALIRSFTLLCVGGPDSEKVFRSSSSTLVIGTHKSVDARLSDQAVSRFHAEISIVDGRARIRDLGSRNQTLVNGVPVVEAYIPEGAILTLGRTKLRFDLGDGHVEVRLSKRGQFGRMIGHSQKMREVFAMLERAAGTDTTVLVEGETGTGKEAVADSIHSESSRADAPLVVIDCSAIPAGLLESELFGHEKGAFTGAHERRIGAFQEANGGTVFLDEIGELPLDLQPRLLRALESRSVRPVGTQTYVPVDFRLIAATNRSLKAEVNAGRFRADLYYRLAVLQVRLPPLRERAEDIPLLVAHMLDDLGGTGTPEGQALLSDWMPRLQAHTWPGNVRELRNYVERYLALGDLGAGAAGEDGPVEASVTELPAQPLADIERSFKEAREDCLRRFERDYVSRKLEEHGGNVSAAARSAGVDRTYFYRLLSRNGLR